MITALRRDIWLKVACATAAAAIVLIPMTLASQAGAASAPSLGGWNVSADGNVIDMVLDNTTGLAGIHPFTEADFPEAQSQFQTGPFGSGLATVFWPGSAGGNFGSLSTELGIPAQLEPYVSKLNDPVRASTEYPAGPASATYPAGAPNGAIEMHSTAGAGGTTATAALGDESVPNFISFSSAKGTSSAIASNTATANATSDLAGISLLGGLIDIGSVTSTASATSNGNTASGTTVTHVTGVTVLGQPASIGSDGLVLPNISNDFGALSGVIGPLMQTALQQTFTGLGLHVTELPTTQTQNGASDTETSGGLQIQLTPPAALAPTVETAVQTLTAHIPVPSQLAIVPTLPGLLQGATLTITIGRATATANGSPPFSNNFTPPPVVLPPVSSQPGTSTISGSTTPGSYIPGSASAGTSSGSATAAGPTLSPTPSATTTQSNAPSTSKALLATPISLSSPMAAGEVVLGLLATAALGYGLWRVARMILPQDRAPICPLGQENL